MTKRVRAAGALILLLVGTAVLYAQEPAIFLQPVEVHRGRLLLGTGLSIVFEGATNDANELTLSAADVTADRTITLPDFGAAAAFLGTTLTTNTVDAANAIWGASNALVFEGATANAHEVTLSPTDVGGDITLTLPGLGNASGAMLASTLTTNDLDAANSVWGVSNALVFEGATANTAELTLAPADVAADRTMTIPDAGAAAVLLFSTLTTNTVDAANSAWFASNSLVFEGATADGFEVTVSPADAPADATVTIPAVTGSVSVMGLIAAGATETAAAVSHAGACIALDTGAGSVVTLPAATGTGNRYCFVVTATGAHQINVVGNDEFVGGVIQGNDSDNTTVMWPAADGADNDRLSLNGTSQGGFIGSVYWLVDISTDNWQVIGYSDASGTEATPFATGQVS